MEDKINKKPFILFIVSFILVTIVLNVIPNIVGDIYLEWWYLIISLLLGLFMGYSITKMSEENIKISRGLVTLGVVLSIVIGFLVPVDNMFIGFTVIYGVVLIYVTIAKVISVSKKDKIDIKKSSNNGIYPIFEDNDLSFNYPIYNQVKVLCYFESSSKDYRVIYKFDDKELSFKILSNINTVESTDSTYLTNLIKIKHARFVDKFINDENKRKQILDQYNDLTSNIDKIRKEVTDELTDELISWMEDYNDVVDKDLAIKDIEEKSIVKLNDNIKLDIDYNISKVSLIFEYKGMNISVGSTINYDVINDKVEIIETHHKD